MNVLMPQNIQICLTEAHPKKPEPQCLPQKLATLIPENRIERAKTDELFGQSRNLLSFSQDKPCCLNSTMACASSLFNRFFEGIKFVKKTSGFPFFYQTKDKPNASCIGHDGAHNGLWNVF